MENEGADINFYFNYMNKTINTDDLINYNERINK